MPRLRILGSTELCDDSGRVLRSVLAQPKRLSLLVYLAVARGEFHRRDKLLGLFWPELDEAHSRDALSQALRFLRKGCGEGVIATRGKDEVGVDREQLFCDAAQFLRAAEAERNAEALSLYRGDLLDGYIAPSARAYQDWLEGERARLRQTAARAARRLAEEKERESNFTTAVSCARRAMELSDVDERTVRELIALLDRLGDRAGAVQAFEMFASRLASEYGTAPAPETLSLIERVRVRERFDPSRAAAITVREPLTARQCDPPKFPDVAGYEVEREIGRGGMATVYLARDTKHGRLVALKTVRPELTAALGPVRFLAEIRMTARFAHPHILPLLDSGSANGALYYVTPYVAGESLRARLATETRLSVDEAVRLATEIAEALDYAHRLGVVHCDIKPSNILLADGHAVVADFGVARAISMSASALCTASGELVVARGTPAYMSPEQARGDEVVDPRADLYSFGCVLHEMLAGAPPFQASCPAVLIAAHATDPPPSLRAIRPEVPLALLALVNQCLEKQAERRPASASAVLASLGAVGTSPRSPASRMRRWAAPAAAAALAIFVLLGTTDRNVWSLGDRPTSPAIDRLAVLPLADSTGLPDQSYVVLGIHDALINELTAISALDVRGRRSVLGYAGTRKSVRAIAHELGVDAVVTGTAHRRGDSVRLDVRLIRAEPTEKQLWAGTYWRSLRDVQEVTNDVVRAIVDKVEVPVTPREAERLGRVRRVDPAAHDAWMKGTYRRNVLDVSSCFRDARIAIGIDSTYAAAHALLASCHVGAVYFASAPPREMFDSAKREAKLALKLDGTSSVAHQQLAWILATYDWDWAAAESTYQRALDSQPNDDDLLTGFAFFQSAMGRGPEGVRLARRAEERNPYSLRAVQHVAMQLYLNGHFDSAEVQARRGIAMDSSYMFSHDRLHWALAAQGKYLAALSAAETASRLAGPGDLRRRAFLAYALARAGRRAEARTILKELLALSREVYVPPTAIAAVHVGLDDREQALNWLQRGFEGRDGDMWLLKVWPLWEPLRGDPRFTDLVRRMRFLN